MFRKNKNSEQTGARARNTPFGAYCYALTNKEHSRTRSVRIYVLFRGDIRGFAALGYFPPKFTNHRRFQMEIFHRYSAPAQQW
uniref:Uncharacterized protein n=1 Tax=Candidatus Kentrum sp. SD TaxID=2126332 RepID=A0A451BPE5_9GAMM|nr:MAG: hypothetical protein BECKSD772D_GA0070982_108816 [Candidatus Kentron sp. SD]